MNDKLLNYDMYRRRCGYDLWDKNELFELKTENQNMNPYYNSDERKDTAHYMWSFFFMWIKWKC